MEPCTRVRGKHDGGLFCSPAIDSPCECEHNNNDSLDARLFFTVVLAVAPAVTMDEASSLSIYTYTHIYIYIHIYIYMYIYIYRGLGLTP